MIGFIVKDLQSSDLNHEILQLAQNRHDIFLIVRNHTPLYTEFGLPFLSYPKVYSNYFDKDYTLIATDLDSALTLSKVKNGARKLFYVWELEFLNNKDFEYNSPIYRMLPLFTRSESYKKALENYANVQASLLYPLKIDELKNG